MFSRKIKILIALTVVLLLGISLPILHIVLNSPGELVIPEEPKASVDEKPSIQYFKLTEDGRLEIVYVSPPEPEVNWVETLMSYLSPLAALAGILSPLFTLGWTIVTKMREGKKEKKSVE